MSLPSTWLPSMSQTPSTQPRFGLSPVANVSSRYFNTGGTPVATTPRLGQTPTSVYHAPSPLRRYESQQLAITGLSRHKSGISPRISPVPPQNPFDPATPDRAPSSASRRSSQQAAPSILLKLYTHAASQVPPDDFHALLAPATMQRISVRENDYVTISVQDGTASCVALVKADLKVARDCVHVSALKQQHLAKSREKNVAVAVTVSRIASPPEASRVVLDSVTLLRPGSKEETASRTQLRHYLCHPVPKPLMKGAFFVATLPEGTEPIIQVASVVPGSVAVIGPKTELRLVPPPTNKPSDPGPFLPHRSTSKVVQKPFRTSLGSGGPPKARSSSSLGGPSTSSLGSKGPKAPRISSIKERNVSGSRDLSEAGPPPPPTTLVTTAPIGGRSPTLPPGAAPQSTSSSTLRAAPVFSNRVQQQQSDRPPVLELPPAYTAFHQTSYTPTATSTNRGMFTHLPITPSILGSSGAHTPSLGPSQMSGPMRGPITRTPTAVGNSMITLQPILSRSPIAATPVSVTPTTATATYSSTGMSFASPAAQLRLAHSSNGINGLRVSPALTTKAPSDMSMRPEARSVDVKIWLGHKVKDSINQAILSYLKESGVHKRMKFTIRWENSEIECEVTNVSPSDRPCRVGSRTDINTRRGLKKPTTFTTKPSARETISEVGLNPRNMDTLRLKNGDVVLLTTTSGRRALCLIQYDSSLTDWDMSCPPVVAKNLGVKPSGDSITMEVAHDIPFARDVDVEVVSPPGDPKANPKVQRAVHNWFKQWRFLSEGNMFPIMTPEGSIQIRILRVNPPPSCIADSETHVHLASPVSR
eukprot:Blabericola_migrator_1__89@NODE_1021_length_5671_cov_172_069950_g701_i0_p1_GENE_NODE_1021_length_5671_cov_172_069950_g701_i0NODE_1021_length_5671_cov_172_069950_g701_i0_p1_ORF_typecomplete_len816_score77_11CDC48_2/PF02933_17/8_5CDC48_2/PF02933_17/0_056CDC48_2/PF02933_17/6_6CDC48_N/PF02359_18/0_54CDC48_N/PF02359_18/0_0036Molydop_binding/PF01568_21/0_1Molydop_binding/PF01568_21/6_1MazE_antitoxin/PF04014_18/3_5e02MazE_antitoxin/PF04014_18/5_4e02MazE_antitoxin/PF04014_18/18_NODE_1021_length_5671_cov